MSNKSSMRLAPPVVTVIASATLALSACDNTIRTNNPPPPPQTAAPTEEPTGEPLPPSNPPPPPAETAKPTENPSSGLPQWDAVKSGHPEGATNPPSPILVLASDGSCYKHWQPGMMRFPDDVKQMKVGGTNYNVQFTKGAPEQGTAVVCPEGAAEALAGNNK